MRNERLSLAPENLKDLWGNIMNFIPTNATT